MRELASILRFDERGLIPAVVQDANDGRVLMVAYMNREALEKTVETGEAHFWSRSRQQLWRKGATSGNAMHCSAIVADCDGDCLLLRVDPRGPACHTGKVSCFFTPLVGSEPDASWSVVLAELARVIRSRNQERPAGSYTTGLFERGIDRIAKKVGEEAVEAVIAAKNQGGEELVKESADLLYHLLVLWEASGVSLSDVAGELERRRR